MAIGYSLFKLEISFSGSKLVEFRKIRYHDSVRSSGRPSVDQLSLNNALVTVGRGGKSNQNNQSK